MSAHVLLDLSRLLWRAGRLAPTGIERVELAHAEHLMNVAPDRLSFAAMMSGGRFGALSDDHARLFVRTVSELWSGHGAASARSASQLAQRLRLELLLSGEGRLHARVCALGEPVTYLLVSHHHLDRASVIARLKERTEARFVCFVHDAIPCEYPEYARAGHDRRHAVRMQTVARHADGVIFNSAATRDAFAPFLARAGRNPRAVVAPLGISLRAPGVAPGISSASPYFVCVGTIEPRKNHLLLFNIWRRFANDHGTTAPRLLIIGQRGWENENVIDMMERCTALKGLVEEHSSVSDEALIRLIRGARALLLPSFAEGYGLPVAEALAMNVPVLCSDLPALREVGQDVPEYLDPLDGLGWQAAILDYMTDTSARRLAQLERMTHWRAPSWGDHFAIVDGLLDAVGARSWTLRTQAFVPAPANRLSLP